MFGSNDNYVPRRDVNYLIAQSYRDGENTALFDFDWERDRYRGMPGFTGPYGDFVMIVPPNSADRLRGLKKETIIYKGHGWQKFKPDDIAWIDARFEIMYPEDVFR